MSHPSDEALLAAHLRGDPRAFGELMARHERRVYGLCLRILGNREDAEDATQEAFLAALAALDPEDAGLAVAPGGELGEVVASAVAVQTALSQVPEEFRVAVVLCDLYRIPYADAAQILEVPVGTVKSRVFRGRLALADCLRDPPHADSDRPPLHVPGPPGTGTRRPASQPTEPDDPHRERQE